MTVNEHSLQAYLGSPPEQRIQDAAARQLVLDSVRQPRALSEVFKLMSVYPMGERPPYLLVYKEAILLVGRM